MKIRRARTAKDLPRWKRLDEVTNLELARLILRQLWQYQDAGGISMGRHYRNALLEGFTDIIRLPKNIYSDAWSEEDLMNEAMRRNPVNNPIPKTRKRVPKLCQLSNLRLGIYLLELLKEFYEEDALANPHYPLWLENKLLNAASRLIPTPRPFPHRPRWTKDAILFEARDRRRKLFEKLFP